MFGHKLTVPQQINMDASLKKCLEDWCEKNEVKSQELDFEILIVSVETNPVRGSYNNNIEERKITNSMTEKFSSNVEINRPFDLEYKNADKTNLDIDKYNIKGLDISKAKQTLTDIRKFDFSDTIYDFSQHSQEIPNFLIHTQNEIINFKCNVSVKMRTKHEKVTSIKEIFAPLLSTDYCQNEGDAIIFTVSGAINSCIYLSHSRVSKSPEEDSIYSIGSISRRF